MAQKANNGRKANSLVRRDDRCYDVPFFGRLEIANAIRHDEIYFVTSIEHV